MTPVLVLVLVMLFATTLANLACWFGVFFASADEVRRQMIRRPLGVATIRNLNVEADGWFHWWRRVVVVQVLLMLFGVVAVLARGWR